MDGAEVIVKPAGFGAVDQIGDDVERVRMLQLGVYNIGDCVIVEEYLRSLLGASNKNTSDTDHVIIYLDIHMLWIYRIFPYTIVAKLRQSYLLVKLLSLD